MDFARGRLGGGLGPSEARVDLEPVIAQVVDELRAGTVDRVIETELHLPDPTVCDASRIGQLVSNLVGNAITHGSDEEPIRLAARTEADTFKLAVSNAGKPIPPAAMERLFQPFFRGEVRASQQGLGLGLYIACEIARAHGGDLSVECSAEQMRFIFTMPLKVAANPAA